MKKILVVHNFYRNKGGEDTNINEELEFLAKNFEVSFYCKNNSKKLTFIDLISFVTRFNFKSNFDFTKKLNEVEPDLVYIHNTWFKINLGIFKILKKRKINTVLKIHNFRYECSLHFFASKHLKNQNTCSQCGFTDIRYKFFNKYFKESYTKSFALYLYSKKYYKILKHFPIKIIAINKFHRSQLIKYGISAEKIRVIPNPINFENYKQSDKENFVIYAGRISEEKGVVEIIHAWNKSNLKDYKLFIIGDGEIKKYLEKKYSTDYVVFLGQLTIKEVLSLMSKAKAVVTATKLFEGQPRILCEASSLGTISIYPSFGGMDEFFPENYSYSFEQFNYHDLVDKFNLLTNSDLITSSQQDVFQNIIKVLDKDTITNQFAKLL